MTYLLRLDLERVRRNLETATGSACSDDDLYRALAARRVWCQSDDWWGAGPRALSLFGEGEILERRDEPATGGTTLPSLVMTAMAIAGV